ncbi:MAG: hypothetical protein ACYCS8_05800 [Acidithiobacillus sp.]
MNYGESTSARPVGLSDGPREDYKPSPRAYRRGDEPPPVEKQAHMTQQPEKAQETPDTQTLIPRAPRIPAKKPMYTEGAYTDRIVAAVQAGQRTTTDIMAATGIPRDIAIKTISYLVLRQRLRELPISDNTPEGDRCVGPANIENPSPQEWDAVRKKVLNGSQTLPEPDIANDALAEAAYVVPTPDERAAPVNGDAASAFKSIVEEWDAIGMDVAAIRAQVSAVQKRLDNMSAALPVLHQAIKASEKARESQAILASIMESVRSLETI